MVLSPTVKLDAAAIQRVTLATPPEITGVMIYPLLEPMAQEFSFECALCKRESVAMEPLEYNQEPELGDVFVPVVVK